MFVLSLIPSRISSILVVAVFDSSARLLISSATTANPLPASPALAASIAAFKAKRLVCSVIELMVSTILPILTDLSINSFTTL